MIRIPAESFAQRRATLPRRKSRSDRPNFSFFPADMKCRNIFAGIIHFSLPFFRPILYLFLFLLFFSFFSA
jgi:hypothetical protein